MIVITQFLAFCNDISHSRYDIRQCRVIYLRCKYDIISVPSYAEGIYHRTTVRYHIEDISPVPKGTDIIAKSPFCLVDKRGFLHGAGDEARTRYLHLGKVALYRMSYTRGTSDIIALIFILSTRNFAFFEKSFLQGKVLPCPAKIFNPSSKALRSLCRTARIGTPGSRWPMKYRPER